MCWRKVVSNFGGCTKQATWLEELVLNRKAMSTKSSKNKEACNWIHQGTSMSAEGVTLFHCSRNEGSTISRTPHPENMLPNLILPALRIVLRKRPATCWNFGFERNSLTNSLTLAWWYRGQAVGPEAFLQINKVSISCPQIKWKAIFIS